MENKPELNSVEDQLSAFYDEILNSGDDKRAIEEYSENLETVRLKFLEKTRIHAEDLGFLFFATLLQCLRIYVVNKLTALEKANVKGGREDALHKAQDKIFKKFGDGSNPLAGDLYASLDAIITLRGVPYDATGYLNDEVKKLNIFKGANHRFATLGHDPALGLIIGTSNILTNTITTSKRLAYIPIISTNHVVYDDAMKNPKVGLGVRNSLMLDKAIGRLKDDKKSVAAALIKQLIHLSTDIYTPCGIQLPGANLVLDNKTTEKLTKYISTGDLVKIGASAGTAALINTIVSAVHGCMFIEKGSDDSFEFEAYQARTKKVVMYSNLIASSSNVLSTAVNGNVKSLDIGGIIITLYRLFNDSKFIWNLEREYIDSETSKIYDKKMEELQLYY